MPPLIAIAAVGCGAYLAYRFARSVQTSLRQQQEASRQAKNAREEAGKSDKTPPRGAETLEQDPKTGVYRPKR